MHCLRAAATLLPPRIASPPRTTHPSTPLRKKSLALATSDLPAADPRGMYVRWHPRSSFPVGHCHAHYHPQRRARCPGFGSRSCRRNPSPQVPPSPAQRTRQARPWTRTYGVIFQSELEAPVPLLVVPGQLGRAPHVLGVRDPDPCVLKESNGRNSDAQRSFQASHHAPLSPGPQENRSRGTQFLPLLSGHGRSSAGVTGSRGQPPGPKRISQASESRIPPGRPKAGLWL